MAEFRDRDGNTFTVPDSETEDLETLRASADFEEVVQEVEPRPAPVTPERKVTPIETAEAHLGQGWFLGYGDELLAGTKTLLDKTPLRKGKEWLSALVGEKPEPVRESYEANLAAEREKLSKAERANPVTAVVADVFGSMLIPGGAMRGVAKAPVATRLATGAAVGGVTGLVEGAGRADRPEGLLSPETAQAASKTALFGAAAAPVGEAALSTLTKLGTKGARRVMGVVDPEGGLVQRTARIKEEAKNLSGMSPKERLAETERLMEKHGDQVLQDIQYTTVKNAGNNVSGLSYSLDKVFDEAHTGLKGSAAVKRLEDHVASVPDPKKFQTQVFNQSNRYLEATQEALDKIKTRARGNLTPTSTGTQVTRVDKAIETYKALLGDAQTGPYLGLGKGGVDPNVMSDTYIALDNVKRALGQAQGRMKGDKTSRSEVQAIYEDLRGFLENPNVWGKEVTDMQKDLNKSWVKYLNVVDAVESTFLSSERKSTTKSAGGWDKVSEANLARIKSVFANPKDPANASELRNLSQWLDASEELTEKLTKYYKPTPELSAEVARIKTMRQKVLEEVENAKVDFGRAEQVGISPQDKALKNLAVLRQRGIPESENVAALEGLQSKRAELTSPVSRLGQAHEYARKVKQTEEELFDIDPTFGKMRSAKRQVQTLIPGAAARFGSTEYIQALEKEDSERDPRLEAALRVDAFRKNTNNPKLKTY